MRSIAHALLSPSAGLPQVSSPAPTIRACFVPPSQFVELAVEVFSMLADATRIRLVLALRDGELSVNHLADIVD